jgi:hypothetical protein
VSLSDEPRIIAALAASMRTATLPSLDAEGQFHAVPSRYIDSATLQERLLALHVDGDAHGVGVDPTRHINLFLFSIGDETPLLIDKYFQAKALDDTVLIVQSNARNFSSRFACNGALVDIDLRNPTHATLGALGTLLGGLVPAHIQYEPTRGAASQDWRWAVGARPNIAMPMAPLARYGALARDISLRNAAMASVTESLTRLQAIERELNERKLSVALSGLSIVRPALNQLAGEVGTWLGAVDFVVERLSQMRFDDAAIAARELRDTMFEVDDKVTQHLGRLRPTHVQGERPQHAQGRRRHAEGIGCATRAPAGQRRHSAATVAARHARHRPAVGAVALVGDQRAPARAADTRARLRHMAILDRRRTHAQQSESQLTTACATVCVRFCCV